MELTRNQNLHILKTSTRWHTDIQVLPVINYNKMIYKNVSIIEKIKEHQKQSSEELNNLFNLLMQKAFRGELV